MLRFDINLLFTVINILILYVLLRKFLFGRVDKIITQRQQMADEQIEKARQEQEQAAQLRTQYESSLADAQKTSAKMLAEAQEKAKEEYGRIVKSAGDEAAKTMEQAREKIGQEREAALKSLSGEISALAMDAAAKVLGEQASPEHDKKLYEQFLTEAGDKT